MNENYTQQQLQVSLKTTTNDEIDRVFVVKKASK